MAYEVEKSDAEWRALLTTEQYQVTRHQGTERAFTGAYWNCHEPGTYHCVGCGTALFRSDDKFDSGTGWPSFHSVADPGSIGTAEDRRLGMDRNEVHCARCGSHLGHLFDDGPEPTGLRYCVNSASLRLERS